MFARLPKLTAEHQRTKSLPTRDVSGDEFIQLATAARISEPELQARLSKFLGTYVVVGDEKLRVIEREATK